MRIVTWATAALACAWLVWFGLVLPERTEAFWLASGLVGGCALIGACLDPKRHANGHVAIVVIALLSLAGFAIGRVLGHWPFAWDALPDRRYAALIAALGLATAFGLVRNMVWARWMAMAFAVTTVLGGMLNTIGLEAPRDDLGLENALGVLGGLVMWTQLVSPSVGARFQQVQPLWTSRDNLVRSARWAAIAGFAASPMLVLYALCQPVAPGTIPSALVLAPIIGAGAVLVVARRTAGILVLALGGLALAVHAGVTLAYADPRNIAGYYVAFWAPAALLGMGAGFIALARARR